MGTPRLIAAATLALLLAVGAAAAQAAPRLPLGHAGRWFTDADGRVVLTHGMNMVAKRPPYAPDAVGFGDDDAAFLADEGLNSVRVGIIYKAVEPQPGVYDEAYLDRIAQTVATLGRHGVLSLLDFHQDLFNERFAGEGFPDWAVQDDGLPNQPNLGFPGNYLGMPALQRAFDHFWDDDVVPGSGGQTLQTRYAAAWRHVAERFRDDPNVLGYDLLNEPWPGSVWQPCIVPTGCPAFDAKLAAFSRRMIAAIREVDPATLVLYEPNVLFNDGVDTTLPDLGDDHLGFSFHDYCLTASAGMAGCAAFDDLVFANAEKHSRTTGDALLLTEFGATDDTRVLRDMAERADRTMVSWQEWHYCGCDDPTTSGPGAKQAIVLDPAKPPTGDNLRPTTLKELSRPYPQVTAGTPTSFAFDGGTFRADWSTARADGAGRFGPDAVTEIAVPRRQYPDGYAVAVEGGRVSGGLGTTALQVVACTGAENVRVTITRAGASSQSCTAPATLRAERLRVTVSPRRVRAGRTVRLTVQVRRGSVRSGTPVARALVRAGHRKARTNARGVAVLRVRYRVAGRRTVSASVGETAVGSATVRVTPPRRARRASARA